MKRKHVKSAKRRGHGTHGYGSMKKNRGKGNKGGKGMAGTGKKADSKKPSINIKEYFGKHGFHSVYNKPVSINVYELSLKTEEFTKKDALKKEGSAFVLDLGKAGYGKLLGTGSVSGKFNIKVDSASSGAIKKVESAGGKVEVLKKKVEKKDTEVHEKNKDSEDDE